MTEKTDHISINKESNKSVEDNSPDLSTRKIRAPKKVPHYLRASTGSCHDACKYGHPHKVNEKPVCPPRRRLSAPLPNGEKAINIQIFVDKKVQKVLKSELEIPYAKDSPPPSDIKLNTKFPPSRKSPVLDSSRLVKENARSFTKSPSPDAPKSIKKVDQFSGKKVEVGSLPKKKVLPKEMSLNPKASLGPLKPKPKPNVTIEKPLFSLESSGRLSGKKTIETRVSESSRTSRSAITKTAGPTVSTSSLRTLKVYAKNPSNPPTIGKGVKGQNLSSQNEKVNVVEKESTNEKVEEKTLHMIEAKGDDISSAVQNEGLLVCSPTEGLLVCSPTPLSPESLNSSSRTNSLSFALNDVDDEECDSDSEEDGSISNYNDSDNLKEGKKSTRNLEDQSHPESLKLKFRKGKVVDIQSGTKSPRRLRFRQGRTLGDNEGTNGGAQRKKYRNKDVENSKKEEESGVVKVVLKHQEMEAKKDEQVLFNNVIEETASKLVEKKRSKVKALVGAFETVISLQERKPDR